MIGAQCFANTISSFGMLVFTASINMVRRGASNGYTRDVLL